LENTKALAQKHRNILEMILNVLRQIGYSTEWKQLDTKEHMYEGRARKNNEFNLEHGNTDETHKTLQGKHIDVENVGLTKP